MGTAMVAVLAGWFTMAAPPPVESADHGAWVERLVGLRDHMHTAFGVGPDLTLLDSDEGLAIVEAAWPQIEVFEVKTGLLKTFAFSKALPEKHPKLFHVLHLGMTDADPKVNEYAASYLEAYAGENFSRNADGYAEWFQKHGDESPAEVLRLTAGPTGNAIQRAEQLAAEGWQLWQQQQMREAAEKFDEAVQLDPNAANAWNGLGWARFNSGDSERALDAFEKCVELEPRHPAGLNGLGQVYLFWREYDQAEKYLKRAAPQAPAAWHGLARLYLLTGKYREARPWLTKIARSEPNDPTVQAMLAAARNRALPDELRRQIEPPGRPDDTEAAAEATAGWREFNAGNMRSAEQSFRRAVAKDPEHLPALNGLGFCLLNNRNAAEAKQYFEKCLELETDAAGPMNGLARCLKAEGNVEEAIALWEAMYEKYPGPNAAAVGLAHAYVEQGEHAKAVPYFEVLLKAQPENAEYQRGLAAARRAAEN